MVVGRQCHMCQRHKLTTGVLSHGRMQGRM